ncbi:MAG: hypothetical protein M0038_02330 [Pseudomonadota bacterium]|jgi:hypothetical protein|nr:hypothetical protein [Pseudomonadota bacterium]
MVARDPTIHSVGISICAPLDFSGKYRTDLIEPLTQLFHDHERYGPVSMFTGVPDDILRNAGDDPEKREFLIRNPMIITGGRFLVPPSHWPKPGWAAEEAASKPPAA